MNAAHEQADSDHLIYANLAIIVAADPDGVIGSDNQLPWHLPDDLRHFRAITTGHTVLMGRKTYESIGRPLPNRRNLVLSRREDWQHPAGVEVFPDIATAMTAAGNEQVFAIGGAEIFRWALPRAHTLYLTRVHCSYPGTVYLPDIGSGWQQVEEQFHPADATHSCAFSFQRWIRDPQKNAQVQDDYYP